MTAPTAAAALRRLKALGDPERAKAVARYFKTAPGEYGEGDRFLGLRVPQIRALVRELRGMPLAETVRLLQSEWHEARLLALLLLVDAYGRGDAESRAAIHDAYLANTAKINNWDLVDLSAGQIVGAHLADGDRSTLTRLARSDDLWERRIAILATSHFIRAGEYAETLRIAKMLLRDPHDLIHKAVGWMLREVGKRDRAAEERFLARHYRTMPRTMLRYAIERFEPERRRQYLAGEV